MNSNLKILVAILMMSFCGSLISQAQTSQPIKRSNTISSANNDYGVNIADSRDRLIFEIGHANWNLTPGGTKVKWYSRAVNFYFMYDIKLNKGANISIAPGVGLGTNVVGHNVNFETNDEGVTFFTTIGDSLTYTRNNLSTNFFDIPLELRFRTNPDKFSRRWKAAIGFKGGYLFNGHTKFVGEDVTGTLPEVKFKNFTIENLNNLRYGYTLRLGYGNFNIVGFYSASPLFQLDTGPGVFPYYIGFSFNSL